MRRRHRRLSLGLIIIVALTAAALWWSGQGRGVGELAGARVVLPFWEDDLQGVMNQQGEVIIPPRLGELRLLHFSQGPLLQRPGHVEEDRAPVETWDDALRATAARLGPVDLLIYEQDEISRWQVNRSWPLLERIEGHGLDFYDSSGRLLVRGESTDSGLYAAGMVGPLLRRGKTIHYPSYSGMRELTFGPAQEAAVHQNYPLAAARGIFLTGQDTVVVGGYFAQDYADSLGPRVDGSPHYGVHPVSPPPRGATIRPATDPPERVHLLTTDGDVLISAADIRIFHREGLLLILPPPGDDTDQIAGFYDYQGRPVLRARRPIVEAAALHDWAVLAYDNGEVEALERRSGTELYYRVDPDRMPVIMSGSRMINTSYFTNLAADENYFWVISNGHLVTVFDREFKQRWAYRLPEFMGKLDATGPGGRLLYSANTFPKRCFVIDTDGRTIASASKTLGPHLMGPYLGPLFRWDGVVLAQGKDIRRLDGGYWIIPNDSKHPSGVIDEAGDWHVKDRPDRRVVAVTHPVPPVPTVTSVVQRDSQGRLAARAIRSGRPLTGVVFQVPGGLQVDAGAVFPTKPIVVHPGLPVLDAIAVGSSYVAVILPGAPQDNATDAPDRVLVYDRRTDRWTEHPGTGIIAIDSRALLITDDSGDTLTGTYRLIDGRELPLGDAPPADSYDLPGLP